MNRTQHHPARRILELVAALHRMGYEQLRIAPGMSASGMHWRCEIVPAASIDPDHGARATGWTEYTAMYSSASGDQYFDWTDATNDAPEELAAKFVERFPEIARAGRGSDAAYATWYREMMALTEPGWYAYADYDIPQDHLPVTSQGNIDAPPPHVPLPPVPEESTAPR